jgi:hypothetical protein
VSAQATRLLQAQAALREGALAEAVALCARDEVACPDGALAEERERIWIEASLAGGRGDEARVRFARFTRRFPHSAYRDRLAALGASGRDGAAP